MNKQVIEPVPEDAALPEILRTMAAALGTIHTRQQVGDAERGQIGTALAVLDQALAGLGKMVQAHERELARLGALVLVHQEIIKRATGQARTSGEVN